mmetsp:Transcript_16092/g.24262  ORF Transcript_16092/g.24262 Transcript_16092/m.24262 type:complete len:237 (-) Transcript_16092:32-742(-)
MIRVDLEQVSEMKIKMIMLRMRSKGALDGEKKIHKLLEVQDLRLLIHPAICLWVEIVAEIILEIVQVLAEMMEVWVRSQMRLALGLQRCLEGQQIQLEHPLVEIVLEEAEPSVEEAGDRNRIADLTPQRRHLAHPHPLEMLRHLEISAEVITLGELVEVNPIVEDLVVLVVATIMVSEGVLQVLEDRMTSDRLGAEDGAHQKVVLIPLPKCVIAAEAMTKCNCGLIHSNNVGILIQ